ncbi:bifunctional 2-polyprenyl-6-hydroxyphenol methylase/3-demethylubiquinol 3-O-methyltransferase UbiG [Thioalkalivibrio sp. HL-Eb18]|uniref:class I SAM-dependent methyltransferase n=1 Tax=Thioalkalivibrio sp. HL-Eb18 TaxID=1266913 RepID=UPI00039E2254|nr:methyltransferase domain-containing protein [Thioalkalivibrio sp. HL-Eb18]
MYDPFARPGRTPPTLSMPHKALDVGFTLDWASAEARHRDCLFLPWLMPARDVWPDTVGSQLAGQGAGTVVESAAAGQVPVSDPASVVELPVDAFNRCLRRHRVVEPRAGRFYPRAFIAGHAGIEAGDRELFRIGALKDARQDARLVADLNHPLSGTDLQLRARVLATHEDGRDGDGMVDVARLLTARGPGMQARWRGRPTDFWSADACEREDPAPDRDFYASPRLVHHLDAEARARIAELYATLTPPGARVLDLMSSWESHLDQLRGPEAVVGLGMNHEELAANEALDQALVHDLNRQPAIPLPPASFDAVVCTASVEYLTRPQAVFASVRELLRPGGVFVVTFSDRCFPTKTIAVWEPLYDFERMGLVLDLFLRAGFDDRSTLSLRGLPRPPDDPYAGRLEHADPVFAVWGCRRD